MFGHRRKADIDSSGQVIGDFAAERATGDVHHIVRISEVFASHLPSRQMMDCALNGDRGRRFTVLVMLFGVETLETGQSGFGILQAGSPALWPPLMRGSQIEIFRGGAHPGALAEVIRAMICLPR